MKRFKKILVSIHLDETDRSIVRYVNHFSRICDADLIDFVCVLPESVDRESGASAHFVSPFSEEQIHSEISDLLEAHLDVEQRKISRITLATGQLTWEILRHVLKGEFDLIVMEKDQRNFLLSEKVARKSPCSVLLVNPSAEPNFRKVAVASDGSSFSKDFIELAANLAVNQKLPRLFIFHCVERGWMDRFSQMEGEGENDKTAIANEKLNALIGYLKNYPLDVSKNLAEESDAWRGINNFCEHLDPDILVVGARGKDSRSQLLLGGNTEQLIRVVDAPMLIYKSKGVGNEILQRIIDAESLHS